MFDNWCPLSSRPRSALHKEMHIFLCRYGNANGQSLFSGLFWFSFCWFAVCLPPLPDPSSYFSAIKSFGSASPLAASRDSSISPSAEFYSLMDSNKHIPGRQPRHRGTAQLRPALPTTQPRVGKRKLHINYNDW